MHDFQSAPNASPVDMEKYIRERAISDLTQLQLQCNTTIPKVVLAWNSNASGKDVTGRAE